MKNINKIYDVLKVENIDAFLLTKPENQRYVSNFTGSTSMVVVLAGKVEFITDGRYKTQINQEKYDFINPVILRQGQNFLDAVKEILEQNNVSRLGIEADHLKTIEYLNLKKILINTEIIPLVEKIDFIRQIKTTDEIECIKKAVAITDKTFSFLRDEIKAGMSEKQVANLLEFKQKEFGADKNSFDPIVASGINSSKPHAGVSDKIIEDGDILTMDFGCMYNGYASDMTRTFFVGTPKNEKLVDIYRVVKATNELQTKMVKAGVSCQEIDLAGRKYMANFGYDKYFIHSTGHSLGLNVHENPRLNSLSTDVLKSGMVVTIEPGIYIEGLGGVRIENDILVTDQGYEILNKSIIDEY